MATISTAHPAASLRGTATFSNVSVGPDGSHDTDHRDVVHLSPNQLQNTVPLGTAGLEDTGAEEAESASVFPIAFRRLPVQLGVSVPVREFRVRNLLAMSPGDVIETRWGHGEDLPLASGDLQLAWTEFEVIDSRLAVRVTRLA